MGDSLYSNSIFLMLGTAIMAFFGFFFWIINARLFSPSQIGIATTLISIATLIANFSLLGLNAGLIRYLPTSSSRNEKINTSFTLVTTIAIILGIFYILNITVFSPKLEFIQKNLLSSILFIGTLLCIALNTLIESVFIAYRSTPYILLKNVVLNVIRVSLPFILIFLGSFGIFASFGVAYLFAVILSILILVVRFRFILSPSVHVHVVKKILKFSFGNYISGFATILPASVLPVIITNKINPSTSAFFYIAMNIANLLFIIPLATSQSLLAEGSYSEKELKKHLKKAVIIIFALLLPAIVFTFLWGNYVLLAFGKQYSVEGFSFLRLVTISGVFVSFNYIGNAYLNVKHKISYNIFFSIINAGIIIGLSYLLLPQKLTGVGIAWIVGNAVAAALYILSILKFI